MRPNTEEQDNVIELFPTQKEVGLTVIVSKETGLSRAISEIAEKIKGAEAEEGRPS